MHTDLQPLVLQAMSDPGFYPHEVESLSRLETHISTIFLTGRYVYKIKKPVDLGFVDFSDLERRRFFCEQEVALNQRLTQGVYQGVVVINFDGTHFRISGAGRPAEYAVKMAQLPARQTLEALLAKQRISPELIEQLAGRLAAFHKQSIQVTDPTIRSYLRAACMENFRQVMPLAGRWLDAKSYDQVRAATLNYFIRHQTLLDRRIAGGCFRDGHGDLRAEHIYLMPDGGIQILDCIEFNERLRIVDQASDLAFLIMDLEYRHQSALARTLLRAYYNQCDDVGLPLVMDFYKCYRAMVRCKVNCIRICRQDTEQSCPPELIAGARDYLRLACGYAHRFARPTVWVFCGLPASGKSVLASELATLQAVALYSSDRLRKSMHGIDPWQQVKGPTDRGIYAPEVGARVYARLLAAARKTVREGASVILDATYSARAERQKLIHLAATSGARIVFAECHAPEAVLRHRLKARDRVSSVSDARLDHFDTLKGRFEPLNEIAPELRVTLNTTQSAEACLRDLVTAVELNGTNLPSRH